MAAVRKLRRRQGRQQAAERARQQQGPGAGLLALAGDVDHRDVQVLLVAGAGRDDEVAGERRAAGRAQRGLDVPAVRQGRDAGLAEDPVTQVDEHRLAQHAGDAEPGTPERRQQDDEAQQEQDGDREHGAGVHRDLPGQRQHQRDHQEHHEPRQLPRPEQQAGQQERHDERVQGDDVRPGHHRGRDQHRREDEQGQDPVLGWGAPAHHGAHRTAHRDGPGAQGRLTQSGHRRPSLVSRWLHCIARDVARERNRRWHVGHQNRFLPCSTSVRTVDPQTWQGCPVRR